MATIDQRRAAIGQLIIRRQTLWRASDLLQAKEGVGVGVVAYRERVDRITKAIRHLLDRIDNDVRTRERTKR